MTRISTAIEHTVAHLQHGNRAVSTLVAVTGWHPR
jgi:hypothetical protein